MLHVHNTEILVMHVPFTWSWKIVWPSRLFSPGLTNLSSFFFPGTPPKLHQSPITHNNYGKWILSTTTPSTILSATTSAGLLPATTPATILPSAAATGVRPAATTTEGKQWELSHQLLHNSRSLLNGKSTLEPMFILSLWAPRYLNCQFLRFPDSGIWTRMLTGEISHYSQPTASSAGIPPFIPLYQ